MKWPPSRISTVALGIREASRCGQLRLTVRHASPPYVDRHRRSSAQTPRAHPGSILLTAPDGCLIASRDIRRRRRTLRSDDRAVACPAHGRPVARTGSVRRRPQPIIRNHWAENHGARIGHPGQESVHGGQFVDRRTRSAQRAGDDRDPGDPMRQRMASAARTVRPSTSPSRAETGRRRSGRPVPRHHSPVKDVGRAGGGGGVGGGRGGEGGGREWSGGGGKEGGGGGGGQVWGGGGGEGGGAVRGGGEEGRRRGGKPTADTGRSREISRKPVFRARQRRGGGDIGGGRQNHRAR